MKFNLRFVGMWALVLAGGLGINAACSTTKAATPAEASVTTSLKQQLAVAFANGDEAEIARLKGLLGQHETNIAERAVGDFLDFLSPFVPGLPPFKEVLGSAIALLAFNRPRKHLINGVKALAKLDIKEAGIDVVRAVGLMHSSAASAVAAEHGPATVGEAGEAA